MGKTEAAQRIVVADAGPLIHLDELDSLDLLDFSEVLVPDAVWNEVARHRPGALANQQVNLCRQTEIPASSRVQTLTPVFGLHQGEREALSLCLARPGAMLLTDDAAARLAADSLGIAAHGTLGLILRSVRRRLRTAEQALKLLADIPERCSLHIRPTLLEHTVRRAQAEWLGTE